MQIPKLPPHIVAILSEIFSNLNSKSICLLRRIQSVFCSIFTASLWAKCEFDCEFGFIISVDSQIIRANELSFMLRVASVICERQGLFSVEVVKPYHIDSSRLNDILPILYTLYTHYLSLLNMDGWMDGSTKC